MNSLQYNHNSNCILMGLHFCFLGQWDIATAENMANVTQGGFNLFFTKTQDQLQKFLEKEIVYGEYFCVIFEHHSKHPFEKKFYSMFYTRLSLNVNNL